jgi:two-component system OmpR family response regulator
VIRDPNRFAGNGFLAGEEMQPSEQSSKGLRILVVEDHEETAKTTALLLRLYGHEVRVALDGPTALQAAQSGLPDVMVLDIALPGMDGCEVARRIGEWSSWRRPLLIAVAGFGEEAERRRSAEAGIDLHLTKPLDPERLEVLLRRFQTIIQ